MVDTDPITREEMVAMFGSGMLIEAVELLFNSPDTKTFGEIRAELRAIAAAKPTPTSPSEGALRAADVIDDWLFEISHTKSPMTPAGLACMAAIIDRHIAADAGVRNAVLEEAAKICDEEAAKRHKYENQFKNSPDPDERKLALHLGGYPGDCAAELATAIRALQAERGGG